MAAWLNEYRHSPQTLRAYRKEAERLLLWLRAEGEQGRDAALASLDRERLEHFEAFSGESLASGGLDWQCACPQAPRVAALSRAAGSGQPPAVVW